MHENGWISGSIYINGPKTNQNNSVNLFVCLDEKPYESKYSGRDGKIVEVRMGSVCLFPASLYHCTVPFESTEDRLVLALDVNPISAVTHRQMSVQ